jgi:hypothetical protein
MKKTLSIVTTTTFVGLLLALTGCGGLIGGYPHGSLYTGTQVPHGMSRMEVSGPGKTGDRGGEACATGILGVVAFGDASLNGAKKAAQITEIHSVEFHETNILGLYSQGCTEVHGK